MVGVTATELRIGNYINSHGVNLDGGGEQINVIVVTSNDIKHIELGSGKYSPIPLTPEVLGEIGFKRVVGYAMKISNNRTLAIYEGKVSLCAMDGGVELCEIKYLHQLQNLYFALVSSELEIKL